MSTIAYAQLTNRREAAQPGTSRKTAPPALETFVDSLAALVPSEVLALHAVILSFTTRTQGNVTEITQPLTLKWVFLGLVVLSTVLYLLARKHPSGSTRDGLDWVRAAIPPLAFVGWTMIQRATAFDALWPEFAEGPAARTVIGLFLAAILSAVAASLAQRADQKPPPSV
jgi:hypothetical protein